MSKWIYDPRQPSALGTAMAKALLAVADDPDDKCHRIAFKGGDWPVSETDLGGMSEEPLARWIDWWLHDHLPNLSETMQLKEEITARDDNDLGREAAEQRLRAEIAELRAKVDRLTDTAFARTSI